MIYVNTIERFHIVKDTITLADILSDIKQEKYKVPIDKIRFFNDQGNLEAADKLKKKLIAFTPSGTFDKRRKADLLLDYNQIVIIDIDKLSPYQVEPLRLLINQHPCTLTSFVSPSGLGIKVFVKISTNIEEHENAFNAVNNAYSHYLKTPTDPSGKDVSRLCFVSSDPDLYYNPKAETFTTISSSSNTVNMTTLEDIVRFTEQKSQYSPGNRNNFIHLFACNCNRAGIQQAETLSFIKTNYGDLPSDEIQSTVSSAYRNTVEFEEVTGRKAPYRPTPKRKSTSQKLQEIETYINSVYDLRYNIVTNRIEYKKRDNKKYELIDDYAENTILRQLNQANIAVSMAKLRTILNSSFVKKYDPFVSYFDNLEPVDDNVDYIHQLAMTITTEEHELWYICFKKWITAMVASLVEPKVINHTVIVFTGKQGIGKTTWMENLVPKGLKQYLYSGTINPNNKDTIIQLSECMLINLDELENLNRSEIGSLKEVITKSQIRIRRAYGHNQEHMMRRASFAGSVNTKQFLNDATGSRRFLCFEVTNIEYNHSIPIDKVLSQAFQLYKNGFQYWFDSSEIEMITTNNEKYQIRNVSEELLLTYFRIPERDERCQYMSATEILAFINGRSGVQTNQGNVIAMGRALSKYNFERVKKGDRYVYKVVQIDSESIYKDQFQDPEDNQDSSFIDDEEQELPF